MTARFAFLPDSRTALAAAAGAPTAGSQRRVVEHEFEGQAGGARALGTAPIRLSSEVLGAGDVIAVYRNMISRVEPSPGARGFEPNYFPYVEFRDTDFPWRYSLHIGAGRIQPWLALVALTTGELEHVAQGAAPLPRLRVLDPAAPLPPVDQLWASAHVHVHRRTDASTQLADIIRSDPAAHHSRLHCLRRLVERVEYQLFVVYRFDPGRA